MNQCRLFLLLRGLPCPTLLFQKYRPCTVFFTAILLFLLLFPTNVSAEETWEEIGEIYSHPTYLESHLVRGEKRTWMMELTGYGFLDIMLPFLPEGIEVSLWSMHNLSSVRVAQWSAEVNTAGAVLALGPGVYELRAEAEYNGPLQARLRFIGVSSGSPSPGAYRGEGPILPLGELVHGFFGFRHASSPVFPNIHSRGFEVQETQDVTFSLVSPANDHGLQIAIWQDDRRIRSTSLRTAGTITANLEPGMYDVVVSTGHAQVPQEYWLHSHTSRAEKDVDGVRYSLLLQEHLDLMGQESLLVILDSPRAETLVEDVRLTDSLGRGLPIAVDYGGTLLLIRPTVPWRSGQMVELRIQTDNDHPFPVDWKQEFRIP